MEIISRPIFWYILLGVPGYFIPCMYAAKFAGNLHVEPGDINRKKDPRWAWYWDNRSWLLYVEFACNVIAFGAPLVAVAAFISYSYPYIR